MKKRTRKQHKPLGFYLGTALMVLSIVLLLFTYYPILMVYFQPAVSIKTYADGQYHLVIPKINAESVITTNVDPWNQASYLPQLQKGVVQAKGTALPGENGVSFLFAHSTDLPWRMTRINTPFLRLGELKTGDLIVVSKDNQTTEYEVTGTKEVAAGDVQYLKEAEKIQTVNNQKQLILQTCTPPGTSFRRLLVFAQSSS